MKGIIRLGDKTSSGGSVLTASTVRSAYGKGIARINDKVYCPITGHGNNFIVEGNLSVIVDGKPAAFDGHKLACGCTLVSSLYIVGVD